MTSDAKIGLLLGLVFIFVIAFLINGLPGLHNKDDTNKLTTNMVGLQNSPPGIGANERKVRLTLEQPASPAAEYEVQAEPVADTTETRFVMALPEEGTSNLIDTATKAVKAVADAVVDAAAAQSDADNTSVQPQPANPRMLKPTTSQYYVVQEGDTLSSIAKKFYGEEQGNRLVNINAIFEANRITLVSADDLYVGQKLVIPPLPSASATGSTQTVLSEKVFSKVESIGKRHLSKNPVVSSSPKQGNIYIVKEGDSLWRIASRQLGDGNRYKEIVKLNSDILSSEDDIKVDMKLKLPAR